MRARAKGNCSTSPGSRHSRNVASLSQSATSLAGGAGTSTVPDSTTAPTLRLLDVFLLHCLLQDSPEDTPEEIAALGRNQHRTAAYGREPGLTLERNGQPVLLMTWAAEILAQCAPLAQALDAANHSHDYSEALLAAQATLAAPESLPSARVLQSMRQDFAGSYTGFIRAQAEQICQHILALPWSAEQQATFEAQAHSSREAQRQTEAADTLDFETWRQAYLDPATLMPS